MAVKDLPDWTKAYLLQGQNAAGDPVAILLEDDGQMAAILQGLGAGGLTTISVDAKGRLQVFVLDDESQWGHVNKVGNAELASRLGGVVAYDWRGQVVYVEDFSRGYGVYTITLDGTGAESAITGDYKVFGGMALRLTGGSDGDGYAWAKGVLPRSPSARLGFMVSVSSQCASTEIFLRARSGDIRYSGALRYLWGGNTLQYLGDDGDYHLVAIHPLQPHARMFNYLKFVIDTSTHKYVRALVGDTEYDLSAYDLDDDLGGYDGACEFEIKTTSEAAANESNYIDHTVLTVNEP